MTKRRIWIWLTAMAVLTAACIFPVGTPGSNPGGIPGEASPADGAAGLAQLSHFRIDVTIATRASINGETVDRIERYWLTAWPSAQAVFESIDARDVEDAPYRMTLGKVGDTGYFLAGGSETGCRAEWGNDQIDVNVDSLNWSLYPVRSSTPMGDEKVSGVAAHKFSLNTDSIGLPNIQAAGEEWIAVEGGYVLKYHLELTGGEDLFGSGGQGTQTIEYVVSEINDGSEVDYPGDCRAVLTEVPVPADARNLVRAPGILHYVTGSTPETNQEFYRQYFFGKGWQQIGETIQMDTGTINAYSEGMGKQFAVVSVQPLESVNFVTVEISSQGAEESSATGTPAPQNSTDTLTRISTAFSKALGGPGSPSVYPSYALSVEEILPAASGGTQLVIEAESQGANLHYVMTKNGKRSEVLVIGETIYSIQNGKAQPGSALTSLGWTTWQMDPAIILPTAAMANPQAQAGATLEGRAADVFVIDSTTLSGALTDMTAGLLSYSITVIRGTIWIDRETGGLLKADLTFEADTRKPGATAPSGRGEGKLYILFHQIGAVTVNPPG